MKYKMTRQRARRLRREQFKEANRNLSEFKGNRYARRHFYETKNDVVNQRRRTRGRNVYYQIIKKHDKIVKTIRHIIPSAKTIRLQKLIFKKY